jgi:hypothetical protein
MDGGWLPHRRLIDDIDRHRADVHLIVVPPSCPLSITPMTSTAPTN